MIAERLLLAALWVWVACATAAYLWQFAGLVEIARRWLETAL